MFGRKFKGIFSKKDKSQDKKSSLKSIFHHSSKPEVVQQAPEPAPPKVQSQPPPPRVQPPPARVQAPAPVTPVKKAPSGPVTPPVGSKASMETLKMFRELKGYYPTPDNGGPLPAVYEKAYAEKQNTLRPLEPERPAPMKEPAYEFFSTNKKEAETTKSPQNRWASLAV